MKKSLLILLLVAAAWLMTGFTAGVRQAPSQAAEEILFEDNFNSGTADNWTLETGWEVEASEGGFALVGKGHHWASLVASPWEDYFFRFRVKLENSQSALHANIRRSGVTRYFIGINRSVTYLSRQNGPQEFKENLARGGGIGAGWHQVVISAVGGQITVYLDGRKLMAYLDPDPFPSGGVAFESLADGAVWIDDVQVGTGLELTPGKTATVGAGAGKTPATPAEGAQPASLKWERTGGPLGGLGYDVRMNPQNPDIMYVTDAKAGVFKSLDGGKTWKPSNKGITTRTGGTNEVIPIFSLTIDPNNPAILWAGTQFQRGAFKSLDGGENWKKMDKGITGDSLTLRGFTIDPHSSDIVYTAGEISSWEWNKAPLPGKEFDKTKGVIYKTLDGGKQWKKIWEGDNLARYIWIDPRNSDVVYASTGIFDREAANSDWKTGQAGGVGILKSVDGGATWKEINNGLKNLYVGSLFMHPTNPDVLLAGAGNVTFIGNSGVYLTMDGGATWKQTLTAYVIAAVEFASSNPSIAYAGNNNEIFRSEDGGNTWRSVSEPPGRWGMAGLCGGTPIDFQVDPRNPDRLFINTYGGGNFISVDGGRTWTDTSKGYTGSMIRDLAVDPEEPGLVYAAARSGIFASTNGGEDWSGISTSIRDLDWHAISIAPDDPKVLIGELNCRRLLARSTDGGLSWNEVAKVNPNMGFRTIEFAPSEPSIVYAGTTGVNSCGSFSTELPASGVRVSVDNGAIWRIANSENMQDASVNKLAVHPQDPQTAFAATSNHGLLKTIDGGKTWLEVGANLFSGKPVINVRFDPSNPAILFAGWFSGGLYRSDDGGNSWVRYGVGLSPEAAVNSIEFDITHPGVMYAADLFSGVFRSENGGKTWKSINQGLLMREVNALALSKDGLHLYAGTEGGGVFRLDMNGEPPQASTRKFTMTPTTAPAQPAAAASPVPASQPTPTAPAGGVISWLQGLCPGLAPVGIIGMGWAGWRRRLIGGKGRQER